MTRGNDRFMWKGGDIKPLGICNRCKHLDETDGIGCAAYPDGIPVDILLGKIDHTKPVEGDRGIQFEERKRAGE